MSTSSATILLGGAPDTLLPLSLAVRLHALAFERSRGKSVIHLLIEAIERFSAARDRIMSHKNKCAIGSEEVKCDSARSEIGIPPILSQHNKIAWMRNKRIGGYMYTLVYQVADFWRREGRKNRTVERILLYN